MYTACSAYPARVLEMQHVLMAFLRTYRKVGTACGGSLTMNTRSAS